MNPSRREALGLAAASATSHNLPQEAPRAFSRAFADAVVELMKAG
jgi:hypothetical protein